MTFFKVDVSNDRRGLDARVGVPPPPSPANGLPASVAPSRDEKDVLDAFGHIFATVDVGLFSVRGPPSPSWMRSGTAVHRRIAAPWPSPAEALTDLKGVAARPMLECGPRAGDFQRQHSGAV